MNYLPTLSQRYLVLNEKRSLFTTCSTCRSPTSLYTSASPTGPSKPTYTEAEHPCETHLKSTNTERSNLMSELDQEIRNGLERLSQPHHAGGSLTFERIATARKKRRTRTAVLVAVPLLALGAFGFAMLASEDNTIVAADGEPATARAGFGITVERTQVVGRGGGTAEVIMDFDQPLPNRDISFVEDLTDADPADGLAYATQDASSVDVCDSVHSFPPPADGTIDVLIPADWFAEGTETHASELDAQANPAKFVVCGPHNGFYQYSIWGPATTDPDEVTISISPDGKRLVVQLGQPTQQTANGPASRDEECAPQIVDDDDLIGLLDLQAHTSPGDEVWALFFFTEPPAVGDPLSINVNQEVKVVWQANGEGDVAMVAIGPDGEEVSPSFGPSLHSGSNWERVPGGEEWGTGWILPEAGCWRIEISRDQTVIATFDLAARN